MGPWSDLYSLGATFYSLLKGFAPPRGEERLINDTIQPLAASSSLSSNYSKNFLKTIDKALSPRVEDRYASAEAWMKDLRVEGGAVSTIQFSPRSSNQPVSVFQFVCLILFPHYVGRAGTFEDETEDSVWDDYCLGNCGRAPGIFY